MNRLLKTADVVERSPDDNRYTIMASTADEDRDGEIIEPSAFSRSLGPYLEKNPVILWAHNWSMPPVGKSIGGRLTDDGLQLDITFAETPFGNEVKYLYDGGFMSSFSVGFIPRNGSAGSDGVYHYDEVELLEVSTVPVPSNRGASMIREATEKDVDTPILKSIFQIPFEVDETVAAYEPTNQISRTAELIRKMTGV